MSRTRASFFSIILFCAVMVGALGFVALPARASGGYWEAWLYDHTVGRVARIAHDGVNTVTVSDTVLPGTGHSRYVAPSHDGRYIAYVSELSLRVYDSMTNSVVATAPLPADTVSALDFTGSPYMWNSTNTQVALGYGYGLFGGSPSWSWSIVVLDVPSNTPIMSLNEGTPIASAVPPDGYIIPIVQQFNDFTLIFNTLYYATEGLPQYPAYAWDFIGSATFAEDSYIGFELDQNSLGEAVMLLSDGAYPGAFQVDSGYAVPNIVSAYNAFTGTRSDYLSVPGAFRVTFVQSSELVAVSFVDIDTGTPTAIRAYTRGGSLAGEMSDGSLIVANVTSLDGIVGGFIATASSGTGRAGGTTVYRVYTRPGSVPAPFTAVPVWNSTLGANYEIAWVSDEGYGPSGTVEAWGSISGSTGTLIEPPILIDPQIVLTPGVIDPLVIPTPLIINPQIVSTVAPVPIVITPPNAVPVGTGLRPGALAMVQTTEGDPLNVRAGAGRSFNVIGQANHRDSVTIIQGPVAADGFNWWQIALPSGLIGWAVDSADGIQTLIPLS